jgi:hypothetical protein
VTYSYGGVTCTYDDVTQAEEAEVAAIAELGALMQKLGLDAQTALAAARSLHVYDDVTYVYDDVTYVYDDACT